MRVWVVFLRGVNVGGHKKFSPSSLVSALSQWEVTNIGAAGTFVIRATASEKLLREAILAALPFDAEVMISDGPSFAEEMDGSRFGPDARVEGVKAFLSVLVKGPVSLPALPLEVPKKDWEVKVVAVAGRYSYSFWRKRGEKMRRYPNEVIERELGLSATTRTWSTIEKVLQKLR